ncbi:glutamate receptor 4-like [Branchiostoma floridae]|uniref:Glutamate receptor 4-like n=1 Tax=Branchiostoma floridae TaxID=7739 RepID=A0A9J7KQD8_BRAFL|nr:glutamate receptor 4-like [Branchiostoma floridae]
MAWAMFLLVGTVLGATSTVTAQQTNDTGNIGSRALVVGVMQYPGFLYKKEDGTYEGVHKDLLTELMDIIGYDFVIKEPADRKYGYKGADGNWVGMVGEIIRGDMDMALGLTIASVRETVIDFSNVVLDERLEIMVKKPGGEIVGREWWRAVITMPVWFMVMASFLITGIVLFVIIRVSPYESRAYSAEVGEASRLSTFGHSLWICFSAMSWQGVDYSPRSFSGRFLVVFWFNFIVWTLILCTGAIVGIFISGPAASPMVPVQSFEDLAENDEIRPALFGGGITEYMFKTSPFVPYNRIHQKALLVNSTIEGVRLAREGKVAFITESAMTRFYSSKKPCDLLSIHDGNRFTARPQAVGLRPGSPLKEPLNNAILQLREGGRLFTLVQKWIVSVVGLFPVSQLCLGHNRKTKWAAMGWCVLAFSGVSPTWSLGSAATGLYLDPAGPR